MELGRLLTDRPRNFPELTIQLEKKTFVHRCNIDPGIERQMFIATIANESRSKLRPNGTLRRFPQATFFSVAIIAPINNIHPTLPLPTRNIKSMIAQQQPTQNKP